VKSKWVAKANAVLLLMEIKNFKYKNSLAVKIAEPRNYNHQFGGKDKKQRTDQSGQDIANKQLIILNMN